MVSRSDVVKSLEIPLVDAVNDDPGVLVMVCSATICLEYESYDIVDSLCAFSESLFLDSSITL